MTTSMKSPGGVTAELRSATLVDCFEKPGIVENIGSRGPGGASNKRMSRETRSGNNVARRGRDI